MVFRTLLPTLTDTGKKGGKHIFRICKPVTCGTFVISAQIARDNLFLSINSRPKNFFFLLTLYISLFLVIYQ